MADMNQDFVKFFMENERHYLGALAIEQVQMPGLSLRLSVLLSNPLRDRTRPILQMTILCRNAVDYAIRPKNSATIEGGPRVEYHAQHPLLENEKLQLIPGGDGEVFNPPLKLGLLIFDQSYVIATKFEIENPEPTSP